jgi:hypothetical protein
LGPDQARLLLRTYREGFAARAGHDLIIEVRRWEATVNVTDAGRGHSVELTADPHSLYPLEGVGGVMPLSDGDREEIRRNIQKTFPGSDPISLASSPLTEAGEGRMLVSGELTMAGQSHEIRFELAIEAHGELTANTSIAQSDWGIKPYRGMMGALRVRDAVTVSFEGRLPVA